MHLKFYRTSWFSVFLVGLSMTAWSNLSSAQDQSLCEAYPLEQRLTALGGRYSSISEGVYADSVSHFQELFAKYQTDFRQVLSAQGMSDVADALFAQVARGEGISDTSVKPGDSLEWMALRRKGEPGTVSPVCMATEQAYDSYRVEVPVDKGDSIETYSFVVPRICMNLAYTGKQTTSKPAPPSCGITAPTEVVAGEPFEVNVSGNWKEASVSVIYEQDQVITTLAASYPQSMSLDKPGLYRLRAEVSNQGSEVAHCETQVLVNRDTAWTIRPFFAAIRTDDDEIVNRDNGLRSAFQTNSGFGGGVGVEYHLNDRFGIEARLVFGWPEARLNVDTETQWLHDTDDLRLTTITVGPNFHFYRGDRVDLFAGPFLGWANLGDVDLSVDSLNTGQWREFDDEFIWGAQLGSDISFTQDALWKLHLGLMYMNLEAEDKRTGEKVDINPLLFLVGLARDL